jgi:hypothetical protein
MYLYKRKFRSPLTSDGKPLMRGRSYEIRGTYFYTTISCLNIFIVIVLAN